MTYKEQFDSAMLCQTPEEASVWLAREVARYEREFGQGREEAERTIQLNLGYGAGYYDDATAQKVLRLFGAVHPIFGSANYHALLTPEGAFQKGVEIGRLLKEAK